MREVIDDVHDELPNNRSSHVASYFPMMVNVAGKRCVVVGGGRVAERKITALLDARAEVTVVSPEVNEKISEWVMQGTVRHHAKTYASGDTQGAFLVIAAADVESVNIQVGQDALANGQLLNRVDHPDDGNFIVPSTVRRGKLLVAVSTSGASPGLAKKICRKLETEYGEEYECYLDLLAEYRLRVRNLVDDPKRRQSLLRGVLQEDEVERALERIRQGQGELLKNEMMDRLVNEELG